MAIEYDIEYSFAPVEREYGVVRMFADDVDDAEELGLEWISESFGDVDDPRIESIAPAKVITNG